MPRIREYVSQPRTAPTISPSVGNRSAAGTAQGLVQLGQTLSALGNHYEKVRRKNQLDSVVLDASLELQEFVFNLEHGTVGEDGSFVPPPDPVEHFGLYQQKVREINERVQEKLGDEELFAAFQGDFQKLALAQSFRVREHSLERQKESVLADLDANEDALAELAAQDDTIGGDFMAVPAVGKLQEMYTRAVEAGVLGADDAQKRFESFRGKVATAQVRRDIRNDPQLALEGLLGEAYEGLSVEKRQHWATIASRELERREKERNRANAKTDPELYSRLRIQAGQGLNVVPEARRAFEDGRMRQEDFDRIVSEVESHQQETGLPSPYQQNVRYIIGMTGGENVVDVAIRQRQAEAVDEFTFWVRQHPNATTAEMEDKAREILKRTLITEPFAINMLAPRFSPGGRVTQTMEDLGVAYDRTKKAFEAGEITRRERDREYNRIWQWMDYLKRQEELNAPAGQRQR